MPEGPNEVWGADYKGEFRLKNGQYCFPLTVSDLATRYLLGCDAHPEVSLEKTKRYFDWLFATYGLPLRIRTDNGVPFASNALGRLSQLSVWFIKLAIYPELIEPGEPQQNGVHERMHRTLKQDTTFPPAASLRAQQRKFDGFRQEFNEERRHEALGMKRPAEVYALGLLIDGNGKAAYSAIRAHVAEYPRDVMVAQTCTSVFGLIGFSGRPGREAELLAYTTTLQPHYGNDWWFLSQHAFSYCETGQLDRADELIDQSLALNPRNAHGAHVRAHVYYEGGEVEAGMDYLQDWLPGYDPAGIMHSHISWHLAL